MAIVTRMRKNGPVYFVANKQSGSLIWERVGSDKREAERRDPAMKKEIAAGTYHGRPTGAVTVAAYAESWLKARTTRTVSDDEDRYRIHVAGRCPWFVKLKLADVRLVHTIRLATELKAPYVNHRGQLVTLAPRSHANIFKSLLRPMFRDAMIAELIMPRDVMKFPPKILCGVSLPREPYDAPHVTALTTDKRVPLHWRMFFTLLFYTGARVGEVSGLRFCDHDHEPKPLGCLLVDKQYEGRALKTSVIVGQNARKVPVHPFLEAALAAWWATGFEQVYCRKPTATDFIVPRRLDSNRNQNGHTAYNGFVAALTRLGIPNRTMHATRNTFISFTRRAGAWEEVVERITHNAKGSVIDAYTTFHWVPLCQAVSAFMAESYEPMKRTG